MAGGGGGGVSNEATTMPRYAGVPRGPRDFLGVATVGAAVAPRARILIVDDEPFNRDVLAQELELLDHESVTAIHGRDALDRLSREAVDLILLDIIMPEMDGFEVLRRLKDDARLRHIPVIMISALDDIDSVVRCVELGADDYLPKPFDPVLLKARIGACLEKKRWRDQEVSYLARIERQMQEIERERARADRLLHAILPPSAVAELKAHDRVTPKRYEGVVVLFGDIVSFTPYCERHPAEEVVANLDQLSRACEELVSAHGLEKIKTVGDCVVATANLLEPHADPVMASVRCAFAMAEAARTNPAKWQMRIGIHVGPVVAGVVGQSKFTFDLWGDTVNIAARLSDLGSEGAVYLSEAAWRRLDGRARGHPLGAVALKGKGQIEVYRCEGVDA
jgi:adenylate cyclase